MNRADFDATAQLGVRLANLYTPDGFVLGVERESDVLNVTATAATLDVAAPRDVDDLLQNGLGVQVNSLMARVEGDPKVCSVIPKHLVQFGPLVTRPEKIICIGFNYRKHAQEVGVAIPTEPPLFAKFRNTLNHHHGTIALPTWLDDKFDFETELVLVIGRECWRVEEAEALGFVAGYSIGNDFSARTRQTATTQFGAGKMSDGFAPVGPWLLTAGRVSDPNNLRLSTRVNGVVRQDWTTRDMIFSCQQLIAYCSQIMTLRPGDIFTGTPQGVIYGEGTPLEQRRWLRPGDEVSSSIEGLGELTVTLV